MYNSRLYIYLYDLPCGSHLLGTSESLSDIACNAITPEPRPFISFPDGFIKHMEHKKEAERSSTVYDDKKELRTYRPLK